MSRNHRSKTVLILVAFALGIFVLGEAILFTRSDSGRLFLARNGVVLSQEGVRKSLSSAVRGSMRRLGVPAGAQEITEIEDDKGVRLRWLVSLPPRASLLQVNAALTEAVEARGGRVFDAWEQSDRETGKRVTLDIGVGRLHTHEIILVRKPGGTGVDIVRIAIILEGFGRQDTDSLANIALDLPFAYTAAVLTNGRDSKRWAKELSQRDREILAQIPMEPLNYPKNSPGRDAILVDMSDGQIRRLVRKHLGIARRPVGLLPYMGGMALQDANVMGLVMGELEKEDLAYIEPAGLSTSIGLDMAAKEQVRFLRLDVNLNPHSTSGRQARAAMHRRLKELADTARRRGFASCVARIDGTLFSVLTREVPKLEKQGVQFVPLTSLLRPSAI